MIRHALLGRHVAVGTVADWVRFAKIDVAIQFIYPASITLPKLAILCLYHRIFTTKVYRRSILATGTIITLNWLACLLLVFLICHPFGYFWQRSETDNEIDDAGSCGNVAAAYCSVSIPNILTDIAILVLPIHAIWHLHTQAAQKIGLIITFMTGCMCVHRFSRP